MSKVPIERKFSFTKSRISNLSILDKDIDYQDTQVSGLAIRVSKKGKKVFRFRKYATGRTQIVTIGPFPEISVYEARKIAGDLLASIANGKDVNESKREKSKACLLGEAFTLYLKNHSRVHKTAESAKTDEWYFSIVPSSMKRAKLEKISPLEFSNLHNKIGLENGKPTANKLLRTINSVYLKLNEWGVYEGPSMVKGIKYYPEPPRKRYLTRDEAPQFFKALKSFDKIVFRDFFLLALYTGIRKGNLQSLRWEQVKIEAGIINLPKTKNGNSQIVPLTSYAKKVLKDRLKATSGEDFVFPSSTSKSGHIQEPKKAWAELLKKAGIENLHIHDLRASAASWMAISGVNNFLIKEFLGHKDTRSTNVYTRLQDVSPIAEALGGGTEKMFEFVPDNLKEGDRDD